MENRIASYSGVTKPYDLNINEQTDNSMGNIPKEFMEYYERITDFRNKLFYKTKQMNTETLQDRLAKLDIGNLDNINKIDLKLFLNEAYGIKTFAHCNYYNMDAIDFYTLDKAIKHAEERLAKMKNGVPTNEPHNEFYSGIYKSQKKALNTKM